MFGPAGPAGPVDSGSREHWTKRLVVFEEDPNEKVFGAFSFTRVDRFLICSIVSLGKDTAAKR